MYTATFANYNNIMKSITVTILGQTYSKSNSRMFSYNNGRPRMFKNPKVLDYVDSSISQLKMQLGNHKAFQGAIKMELTVYYQSRRSDLDISLIQDIFQQKVNKTYKIVEFEGIYLNDRQIDEIHAIRKLDKLNPRIEATITEL
jgi:Holliday junction resolvase RusA-like endonuclease